MPQEVTSTATLLLPLSPSQGCFVPSSPVPAPKDTGLAAGSACCSLKPRSVPSFFHAHFSVKAAVYFPARAVPKQVALVPPGPVLSCILPLCVSQIPLPPVRLSPSSHCLNLKPQLSCLDFVAIHIQTSAPSRVSISNSSHLSVGKFSFVADYLCPSRRFQELQLSLTSVQCSIKWSVWK